MDETIEVIGAGASTAAANHARIGLAVEVSRDDISSALSALTEVSERISAALRRAGADGGEIATSGLSLNPRRDERGVPVIGFTAQHRISVVTREIDRIGDLVGAAVDVAGSALRLEDVRLGIDDDGALEARAREWAFADAETRAADLARLAGVTLGAVVRVSEEALVGGPRPMQLNKAAFPVEAGEHAVEVTLRVVYAIARF